MSMENNLKGLTLSTLREHIIRYGAKYMEAFESDLFYDCQIVEKMEAGDSLFWMVSASHTYLYSAEKMAELGLDGVYGDRFNYRIDCYINRIGEKEYSMTRVECFQIEDAVMIEIEHIKSK